MQQRYLYTKPALQPGEAVLLPALPRRRWQEPLVMEPAVSQRNQNFVPVSGDWSGQNTALSTCVRQPGSMAGRGILRAAGVRISPYSGYTGWRNRRFGERMAYAPRVGMKV